MNKRVGTVCFIVENNKVLLALIEYSPSVRKWNGLGGFAETNETPEDAVVREIREETFIEVNKKDLIRVKDLNLDIELIVYRINKWSGKLEIKDKSIKELKWFSFAEIPYNQMHEGNGKWFAELLT